MTDRKLEEVAALLPADPESRETCDGMADDYAYHRALDEVDRLWDAAPGTPEHRRLEELGAAIAAYEAEKYPMDGSP